MQKWKEMSKYQQWGTDCNSEGWCSEWICGKLRLSYSCNKKADNETHVLKYTALEMCRSAEQEIGWGLVWEGNIIYRIAPTWAIRQIWINQSINQSINNLFSLKLQPRLNPFSISCVAFKVKRTLIKSLRGVLKLSYWFTTGTGVIRSDFFIFCFALITLNIKSLNFGFVPFKKKKFSYFILPVLNCLYIIELSWFFSYLFIWQCKTWEYYNLTLCIPWVAVYFSLLSF